MSKTKNKGDVYWYIPNKKKPIAYSPIATKLLVDLLSHEDKSRTVRDVCNLINYDVEAKKILQIYIEKGYGDVLGYTLFG